MERSEKMVGSGTRTSDLFRVKVSPTHTYNNFYVRGGTAKRLSIRVRSADHGLEIGY